MEILTGASKVKIGNSNISSVGRDQNNNYYTQTTIVQTRGKRKVDRSLPELSEFTEIKRGNIYKTKDGVCYTWQLCSNGKDDTEAAVYHAELNISGSFGQKKFTVKTYRGRDAMKEWRRDFSQCSKEWLRDVPLFGYNRSAVPSLIFSGELVPLSHMEARMGWVGLLYIDLLRKNLGCSRIELWMDPTQGRFYRGPSGPKCCHWRDEKFIVTVPSDVEFLKEDVVIRYFASKQEDRGLLTTLRYIGHFEILDDIPGTSHVISNLTNSTIAFTESVRWRSWSDCLGKRRAMPDGATRFRLRDDRRKIQVESVGKSAAWLTQASSVFHALNISLDEDLSTYKLAKFPFIKFTGTLQKSKRKQQRRRVLRTPIYFIICPSDHPIYHWSSDPTGQTPLLPEMCKYLGLPFKLVYLKATPFCYSWPTKVYKQIHDYQISRKFDPKTTDFARSLGYPIFDVVPPEDRFQEIVEGQHQVLAELEDLYLPTAKDDSERLNTNLSDDNQGKDPIPTEPDDSFLLELLFYGIKAEGNPQSHSTFISMNNANRVKPRKRTKRKRISALFAPFIRRLRYLGCSNTDY